MNAINLKKKSKLIPALFVVTSTKPNGFSVCFVDNLIDTSKTIGYTIYYKTPGELDVAFFSRGVNFRNYRNLRGLAPENLQQEFVKILEETTELKVNIVPRPDLPD